MVCMGKQRGVNSVQLTMMSQLLGQKVQNSFLSIMTMVEEFKVWEYKKSLLETTVSLQITSPIMMGKLDIIVPLRLIVTLVPIFLVENLELCHQKSKYAQLLRSLTS